MEESIRMAWIDPITRQLEGVLVELAGEDDGALADYIPELARVDPALFGIALVSARGHIYRAGDADALFTIQSVSKPFVYAMALADLGIERVLERVNVEPSGEAFNAISLEPGTGRPANAMINAGAILVTSMVPAEDEVHRFDRILQMFSAFAGRQLDVDEAVYRSEVATGDRNRALAYLMRNAGVLAGSVEAAVDVYFRQCAIRVSAADIATMAATLANRGLNPVTGVRVVDRGVASHVLTVMSTCGMYDYSGRWLVDVGLPAKSGVSGAVVAASLDEFGVGRVQPARRQQWEQCARGACVQGARGPVRAPDAAAVRGRLPPSIPKRSASWRSTRRAGVRRAVAHRHPGLTSSSADCREISISRTPSRCCGRSTT